VNIRDYINNPTRLRAKSAPADAAALEELRTKTGYSAGPVLRWILLTENGGPATPGDVDLPDGSTTSMVEFLSVREMINSWVAMGTPEPGYPAVYVPIMEDVNGNYLVLNETENVFFWNHDTAELLDLAVSLESYPAYRKPFDPSPPPEFYKHVPLGVQLFERYATLGPVALQTESDPEALGQLLEVAEYKSDLALVRAVLSRGRQLGDAFRPLAEALLGAVAGDGKTDNPFPMLQAFLDAGVDINAAGFRGNTALMKAAIGNTPEVVKWLLDHGADPLRTNDHGFTAKREAIAAKRPENAALLP
jgi:hypothetical protein